MMKILWSLMIVTAFTCQSVYSTFNYEMYRCENDDVVCYIYDGMKKGGVSCKFKEQSDVAED